jgi:hypothetical protein
MQYCDDENVEEFRRIQQWREPAFQEIQRSDGHALVDFPQARIGQPGGDRRSPVGPNLQVIERSR